MDGVVGLIMVALAGSWLVTEIVLLYLRNPAPAVIPAETEREIIRDLHEQITGETPEYERYKVEPSQLTPDMEDLLDTEDEPQHWDRYL